MNGGSPHFVSNSTPPSGRARQSGLASSSPSVTGASSGSTSPSRRLAQRLEGGMSERFPASTDEWPDDKLPVHFRRRHRRHRHQEAEGVAGHRDHPAGERQRHRVLAHRERRRLRHADHRRPTRGSSTPSRRARLPRPALLHRVQARRLSAALTDAAATFAWKAKYAMAPNTRWRCGWRGTTAGCISTWAHPTGQSSRSPASGWPARRWRHPCGTGDPRISGLCRRQRPAGHWSRSGRCGRTSPTRRGR